MLQWDVVTSQLGIIHTELVFLATLIVGKCSISFQNKVAPILCFVCDKRKGKVFANAISMTKLGKLMRQNITWLITGSILLLFPFPCPNKSTNTHSNSCLFGQYYSMCIWCYLHTMFYFWTVTTLQGWVTDVLTGWKTNVKRGHEREGEGEIERQR